MLLPLLAETAGSPPPSATSIACRYVSAAALAGVDDWAEADPALAVEAHHLQLLVEPVVGRCGVDRHAGQRQIGDDTLQAGRLLHDVLAREVVAAALENLDQHLCG